MIQPRYPVYVISKGRFQNCLTAKFLLRDEVEFILVVEEEEAQEYATQFGAHRVQILPFSNLGLGSIPARNWVWEDSKASGAERHWILDDNIMGVLRRYCGKRLYCQSGVAFRAIEDFADRYDNLAIIGMNYDKFILDNRKMPPFYLNNHVYSNLLIKNDLPNRWRGRYNEDTDLCLQVLADGWCTVLVNAFGVQKMATMTMKGGNATELYVGDGRLKMARALERLWPRVVKTGRRFNRPQHIVNSSWQKFDTPLKLKPGIDLSKLQPNEYGMELKAIKEIRSPNIKKLFERFQQKG